jgi:hypothetical protein
VDAVGEAPVEGDKRSGGEGDIEGNEPGPRAAARARVEAKSEGGWLSHPRA